MKKKRPKGINKKKKKEKKGEEEDWEKEAEDLFGEFYDRFYGIPSRMTVSYCIRLLHMKCFFQVRICRADNARPTLSYCLLSIILENEKLTMIYIQEDS